MSPPLSGPHIALDLGTTTLSGRLLSPDGVQLAEERIDNPQRIMGTDILARLQKAHEGGGKRLQTLLASAIRELVASLAARGGCSADAIVGAAAAGNPGISCLLRNLPVTSLLFPPHKAPDKTLVRLTPDSVDLGLAVPVDLFPLVSGFVGGDLLAAILAVESVDSPPRGVIPGTLLIDIGTNAELTVWDGVCWWASSAAAGPAFEAGNITAGMTMAHGAVSDVTLDEDRLRLVVTGGSPPRGLCGSGLAALVAAALQGGLIDRTGRICAADEIDTNLGRYLVEHERAHAIRFHHGAEGELLLTQQDLRNFQLAKGAVYAGVLVLLERAGFTTKEVRQVLVTGALGTALPREVLKRVALLPEPMLDKTRLVKNLVLDGLQTYLTAADGTQRLNSLLATVRPFPLSGTPAFERLFLSALAFDCGGEQENH